MVDSIDIHDLTLEELSGVVDIYPWYAGARVELCRRMSEMGALSDSQLAETALRMGSRTILLKMVSSSEKLDCSDKDAKMLVAKYVSTETKRDRKVYVVGGDYFSQAEYNQVRRSDDGIYSSFASGASGTGIAGAEEGEPDFDFCTETLAKVYLEQDYVDRALDIYAKLSLRYPEKSVYFATLIDEINKNRNSK